MTVGLRCDSLALSGAILGVSLAISSADAQTPEAPPEPPPITSLRYDEDYSYLRDPGKRSGAWWEPLKFIPLDAGGWSYLTVGDEQRVRYERFSRAEARRRRRIGESQHRRHHSPDYAPGSGTSLRLGEREVLTDADDVIMRSFLDLWVGRSPVSKMLRGSLLGE